MNLDEVIARRDRMVAMGTDEADAVARAVSAIECESEEYPRQWYWESLMHQSDGPNKVRLEWPMKLAGNVDPNVYVTHEDMSEGFAPVAGSEYHHMFECERPKAAVRKYRGKRKAKRDEVIDMRAMVRPENPIMRMESIHIDAND